MTLQSAYEHISESRHLDGLDREAAWDRAMDRIGEWGIPCPKCEAYFQPFPMLNHWEGITFRARNGWKEHMDKGTVEWRCPECENIVEVEI